MEASVTKNKARVEKIAAEAERWSIAEFMADMRTMVNDPSCSDLVFVCKDGERVHASRMLLARRSQVLKSMLMNGMAESKLSEVPLPEISSAVLLSIFEFLYTGTILHHQPKDWRMAFEIISGARFFLLDLGKILGRFLMDEISEVAGDLGKAAVRLTEAMEFEDLCDQQDVILVELVKVLNSKHLQPTHLRQLSDKAFRFFLEKTKSYDDDGEKLSFREYLRFRQLMLWFICQQVLDGDEAEKLVDSAVPDEETALFLWRDPFDMEILVSIDRSSLNSILKDNASADSLAMSLSVIDLRRIPALLIVTVVQPLGIISSAELLKAFQFQALRRPLVWKRPECRWKHGTAYTTLEDGSVIEKSTAREGFATGTAPMSRCYGHYSWSFVIENLVHDPFFFPTIVRLDSWAHRAGYVQRCSNTMVRR